MAVASREMWPTNRSSWVLLINASCTRVGSSLVANSANARENVASLGTCPGRSQPHSRRERLSDPRYSISIEVVGTFITILATNARANAARSSSGRPGRPGQWRKNASMRTNSSVLISRLCVSLSGPSSSVSHQGNRVKESCCDKAGKEVIVPRGDFALEAEAVLSGRPADQVEGHVLDGGEIGGGVISELVPEN